MPPHRSRGDATDDTFIVSSDAGADSPPTGNLDGIQDDLTVVGGSGSANRLIVGSRWGRFRRQCNRLF